MSQQKTFSPGLRQTQSSNDKLHTTGNSVSDLNGHWQLLETPGFVACETLNEHATSELGEEDPMPKANSRQLWKRGIDWPVVVWIGMVHLLALVAPFYFSWQGLLACAALILATGAFG